MRTLYAFAAVLLVAFTAALPAPAWSQTDSPRPDAPLRVSTRVLEPLVVQQGETLSGFSIDIWKEIARRTGMRYEFVVVESVKEMLDHLEAGNVDVAIAAISMTPEREAKFDFTHSYLQSGLQVMTTSRSTSYLDELRLIRWRDVFTAIGLLAALTLVFAHLVWLAERKRNPDFPSGYLQGVGEGIWWSFVTVLTVGYGDRTPKGVLGRILAILWMLAGVFLLAHVTATITSRMTLRSLEAQVNGPADLPGKRVVTVANTTADVFLASHAIGHTTVPQIEQAYAQLLTGEVDAVVYDAPILNYYASSKGQGKVRMVGEVFKPEPYGIALTQNSPHRKAINRAVLEIFTDGTYQELSRRWFGTQ